MLDRLACAGERGAGGAGEASVKYLLLVYLDEAWRTRSLAERRQIFEEQTRLADELTAKGQYLGGNPLHPPATATTVRVRDGKRLLTDGPFAETREQLGGYMLVDVEDEEAAIAIATQSPVARVGTVEVRLVREGPPTT
jgi:hypothetical protein